MATILAHLEVKPGMESQWEAGCPPRPENIFLPAAAAAAAKQTHPPLSPEVSPSLDGGRVVGRAGPVGGEPPAGNDAVLRSFGQRARAGKNNAHASVSAKRLHRRRTRNATVCDCLGDDCGWGGVIAVF